MSKQEIEQKMAAYTDSELLEEVETAYNSLMTITEEDMNSEWHEACFAATVVLAMEMNKRGLKRREGNHE